MSQGFSRTIPWQTIIKHSMPYLTMANHNKSFHAMRSDLSVFERSECSDLAVFERSERSNLPVFALIIATVH